jgi:hypothetical protein
VAGPGPDAPKRLGRIERVQQLRRLALLFFLACVGGDPRHALHERFVRIERGRRRDRAIRGRRIRHLPFAFVIFLDDVCEDELVSVA